VNLTCFRLEGFGGNSRVTFSLLREEFLQIEELYVTWLLRFDFWNYLIPLVRNQQLED
jgi:hypothetical protein